MRDARKASKRIICLLLSVIMLMTMAPVSVFADNIIDAPLNGEEGSGWGDFAAPPGDTLDSSELSPGGDMLGDSPNDPSGGLDEDDIGDIGQDDEVDDDGGGNSDEDVAKDPQEDVSGDDIVGSDELGAVDDGESPVSTEPVIESVSDPVATPTNALGASGLTDSWIQDYQKAAFSRASLSRAADVPGTTPIQWSGGPITFANSAYIGSPMPKISFNGETAFCYEFNGSEPSGTYFLEGEGDNETVKQYLANYYAGSQSNASYIATQALIWSELMGTSVSSWGGSGGASAAGQISGGGADSSGFTYEVYDGGTQRICLRAESVDGPEEPTEPTEPETCPDCPPTRVEVETTVDTVSEVYNSKSFEYSDGIGQLTIRKHDQDGNSLDGALFNIVVRFTDGSNITVNNWEVDNGARLFTWTHPPDNYDPATVTVTEVVPPEHYSRDPIPKTVVVTPTYTRVTIVETWTVTITTLTHTYTVIDIDCGEVIDSYVEEETTTDSTAPIIESFPDFIAGDRETTVTFVNERETGQLIVTKRDANTGQPLAGAEIHVWGQDLGNAGIYDMITTTGPDGMAVFDGLFPGTYAIQETKPPFGYNLNNQVQTAVIQSNETVRKEIHNTRKAGLFIKKVDENGQPIGGATFELRRGSGEVLMREVTDQNGIIYRGYLETDTYIVEEIKAPEGYLLDENPIQSIYIPNTDDNKEFVLTFVNKKKPAIEIEKVDGTTPTLKLEGAVFRITDTRTGIYWDVKTGADGKALLEDLEINTTYIVEELEAPEGYVNSGYRQEIVLKEARVHTLTISNEMKPSLRIVKKDAETGGRLSGAIFRLATEGGANYQDVTTGAHGEVLITDIAPGTYTLTEIKEPNGYVIDSTPRTIIIKEGEHTVIEITNHQKPSLRLVKKDALTGSVLAGAVYRLAKEGGVDYQDVTTSRNGDVLITDLEPGTYILTEIKAPNGYLLNETPQTVIIRDGEHNVIELIDYKKPSLEIVKKDKETGELLEGATFRVSWNNGAEYSDVTTDESGKAVVTDLNDGWYTVTEIKAPEGYLLNSQPEQILLKPGEAGVIEMFNEKKPSLTLLKVDNVTKTPLQYAKFRIERKTDTGTILIGEYVSDENGEVFLENIQPGRYLITELEAPAGYNIDSVTHEVTIEFNKAYVLEITNTPKSPIYIQKVDDKGVPLYGAEFKVTTMNGAMVGTVKTGVTGYAIIPYAQPGWYVVEEVRAPDGYVISDAPLNIEVLSGKPAQVSFVNLKKPIMQIMKLDAGSGKALIGAKFKVTEANGKFIGEYTTDANGVVLLDTLLPGSYIVAETRAPDGYILDMTPQTVMLEAGKTARVEFYDIAKPGLQLIKLDKLTGKPIKGTMFDVVELKGSAKNDLGTFTTGENGTFFIPDLAPGHYVITEVKAAEGYIPDATPRSVYVEGGKLNVVEVFNIPYSDLWLLKIDAETREPLANAVFKLFDEKRLEVGTYTSSELGEIHLASMPSGIYFLQEVKAPAGYLLDNTVKQIELIGGKTTTVEWKNIPLGSARIIKIDSETKKPLYGVRFELIDGKGASLGQFTTNQDGVITLKRNLRPGKYKIRELSAPADYFVDKTVYDIVVKDGETTELTIENTKLGSLRIVKEDAKTGDKLPLASFLLYDAKMNLIGEYITNDKGEIFIPNAFVSGTYKLKEIKAPEGFVLDDQVRTVELKVGETTEFLVKNDPIVGNVQIVKVSDGKNGITGDKEGDPLKGATFQIFDEELEIVDEITTDENGIAKSIDLPLGKYVLKETEAPRYYLTNGEPIYVEIKVHGDLIRITVENTPEELEVDVTKRGVAETMAGELINYEFSDIANKSNTALDEFYWRDTLPTDAVRIQSLSTGTWSERGTYEVWVRTNLKDWKRIEDNLHTNSEYTIDMRPSALGLAASEYVTEYKLEFGTAAEGFHSETNPFISVRVNNGLPMGYRFTNQTDVGGKVSKEWVYDRDSWVTVIYKPDQKLPRTGGPAS